ncbi:hypothetical protein GCM10009525_22620 [Streptosporangium amethystogenes subsp. fukuiense]
MAGFSDLGTSANVAYGYPGVGLGHVRARSPPEAAGAVPEPSPALAAPLTFYPEQAAQMSGSETAPALAVFSAVRDTGLFSGDQSRRRWAPAARASQ